MTTSKDKIRNRESYKMFLTISVAFDISKKTGLEKVYDIMDNKSMFGSKTNALYARESLNQLLKTYKL